MQIFNVRMFPGGILNHEASKVERVVPKRVELGPLPSAWGQADPPVDFLAFLRPSHPVAA